MTVNGLTVAQITRILGSTLTPRGIEQWKRSRNRLLGMTPMEALEAGRDEEVLAAARAFEEGAFV